MTTETDSSLSSSLASESRLSRLFNIFRNIRFSRLMSGRHWRLSFEMIPQALCLMVAVFSAVLAAGCASSGPLRNIYLLSLHSPAIEVRIGYFSLCAKTGDEDWSCSNGELPESYTNMSAAQAWDLVGLARHYRRQVTFVGLVLASSAIMVVVIALLATFPGWHSEAEYDDDGDVIEEREVKPFPSKPILNASVLALLVGTVLSLAAALWQHSAAASTAATVQFMSKGEITPTVGIAATVLVWLSFGLCLLAAGAITSVALSIAILFGVED